MTVLSRPLWTSYAEHPGMLPRETIFSHLPEASLAEQGDIIAWGRSCRTDTRIQRDFISGLCSPALTSPRKTIYCPLNIATVPHHATVLPEETVCAPVYATVSIKVCAQSKMFVVVSLADWINEQQRGLNKYNFILRWLEGKQQRFEQSDLGIEVYGCLRCCGGVVDKMWFWLVSRVRKGEKLRM